MTRKSRKGGRPALAAAAFLLCAAAAHAGGPPGYPAGSPEAFLALGMPHAAGREFLSLPAGQRAHSAVLPDLMLALERAGRADLALSLFAGTRSSLYEPVRSKAFFAAGTVLFRQGRHKAAAEAFRSVSKGSGESARAASYMARILAAGGDFRGASLELARIPDSVEKSVIAGEIELARGDPAAAAAAWSISPPGSPRHPQMALSLSRAGAAAADPGVLRAAADNVPAGKHPDRAALLEALSFARLSLGDWEGALSASRDALSAASAWKSAAERHPPWDGTREGAAGAVRSLTALFPHGEARERFMAFGRGFVAASALFEAQGVMQERNAELLRRVASAKSGISRRKDDVAALIGRSEEIVKTVRARKTRSEGVRGRLREAADALPIVEWGAKTDPRRAGILEEADRKIRVLKGWIARAGAAADAAAGSVDAAALPPGDRRMLFVAQRRIAGLEDAIYSLEGRTAFLKAAVWNEWKRAYLARMAVAGEKAAAAADAMSAVASRAGRAIPHLREEQGKIGIWEAYLDRFDERLSSAMHSLEKRRAETRSAADRELSGAVRELLSAIDRSALHARYLGARAADERRFADRRSDLLAEATAHWEALLSHPGGAGLFADEALYALAELRFEEAENLFLEKEEDAGKAPDFSLPLSLFRRVVEEHPESPYRERALYGIALSCQETGASDDAASAMRELLSRHPGTRFADELRLRLGEYAFDESDYRKAEEEYRKVSAGASPDVRVTAMFKLGWSLFLQGRPGEAAGHFLDALLLSPAAARTGGVAKEALQMASRSLVEANMESEAEALLERRGGIALGPPLLLHMQGMLETQNRYIDAAAVADRMGESYPGSMERVDAERAAADALVKAGKEEVGQARRERFLVLFGPGSAWRSRPGREAGDIARADAAIEEALRSAAFFFHAESRRSPPGDRARVLSLYDGYLKHYPSSPGAEEVAYQRAWLLFEDGRKRESTAAFEQVAGRPDGARREASGFMALQSAKDASSPSDAGSQAEIVRLALEYERSFEGGGRIFLVLMDRARAHANLRRFDLAAEAAAKAAGAAPDPAGVRAALRLSGEAQFETGDFAAAEKAFRGYLGAGPSPEEEAEAKRWIGFSMFRRAESAPADRPSEEAELFDRVHREFPSLEIAPIARFRAGAAHEAAGNHAGAVEAFLSVESGKADHSLSLDASRRLGRLYEKEGNHLAAAERHERLAIRKDHPEGERISSRLKAADLFEAGKDGVRARKNLLEAASMPGAPPDLKVQLLFRAGESARAEGNAAEADRHYEKAVEVHRAHPEAAASAAGRALFLRAEHRFLRYRQLSIVPPFGRTFPAKQAALEECAKLYLEAIRLGDRDTVSASLHRLGEAFEDFRSAILGSPHPRGMSEPEREEYVFLLEEKASPIEEKAIEAYERNLRQAVEADYRSEWVEKSLGRLKAVRPARFGKKGENSADGGMMLIEQGKWKEARAILEKSVRDKPEAPQGWINLGLFREMYEGDYALALECYRRYVDMNGSRKDEVRRWMEWLEK